ncbi:MAG: bifunctional metallophosphatase/5'-nucleotidase [Planctomycetota bacterium]
MVHRRAAAERRFAYVAALGLVSGMAGTAQAASTVTLLHNNDGESQLISAPGQPAFGGAARFVSLLDEFRTTAANPVVLSSGDNFLAGPEFNASLNDGVFYDARVLNAINYDAVVLGNHDFDFGPDVLADFIGEVDSSVPYLSANLDFSGEPALQARVDEGRIAPSTIVTLDDGDRVGIVGATTPSLPSISSPRNVVVNDVLPAVQAEIDQLTAQGVNKIVLVSHLQSINENIALIPQLRGVDVAIAGGGDELLANPGNPLVPGDEGSVFGPYPVISSTDEGGNVVAVTNQDGAVVPVITTPGEYAYLGALEVEFDANGNVTAANGQPFVVVDSSENAQLGVSPDSTIQATVTDPVQAFVDGLSQTVVANSEVALNGIRAGGIRTQETNLGNLVADALLSTAQQLAGTFGVDTPTVALQNGGGIRNNNIIPAGELTRLTTFDILPFANFVSVIEDVSAAQFQDVLENAVSQVENVGGRFAQVSGFSFTYDPQADPGSRVIDVILDNGTILISNGQVVDESATVAISTIDFLARGGDDYDFGTLDFTALGVTYQQSLESFLVNDLNGQVLASAYPEGGAGRISIAGFRDMVATTVIPSPTAVAGGLGLMGLLAGRRRRRQGEAG